MDDILQAQFDRVEHALGTLVDSIASYNPNPQAAIDLVAADDELSHGLDQLAKHQANHARLQALRADANALEEQLKSSVAALASLRKELSETPATVFPPDARPVPFTELLQYAKTISRYTVPPTFRERVPDADADVSTPKDAPPLDAPTSAPATNGLNTPTTALAPVDVPVPADVPPDADSPAAAPEISASEAEWLQKLKDSGHAWFPWPDMDKIRRGNLWKLYYYREQGRNLDDFDIEAHEEADRKRFEDEPQEVQNALQGQEPQEVQRVQQGLPVQGPPPSAPVSASAAPAPTGAGFTLFDDMEDDDDD